MSTPEKTLLPRVVDDAEVLARYVNSARWVRENGTIRPDAFIPPKDLNLSVTRHTGLTDPEIWAVGEGVVAARGLQLLGRADITADDVSPELRVESAPLPENPNHAHVVGWPQDKPAQKNIAQQLAARSTYTPKP